MLNKCDNCNKVTQRKNTEMCSTPNGWTDKTLDDGHDMKER